MAILYVASDQNSAGKTAVCAAIASDLSKSGKRVAVIKLSMGVARGSEDPDVGLYQGTLGNQILVESLSLAKKSLTKDSVEKFKNDADEIIKDRDILIIEGSASITPKNAAKLSDSVNARVLFVSKYDPNLDGNSLSKICRAFGDSLIGILVNGLTRYRSSEVKTKLIPGMESSDLKLLGIIPEDRRLLSVSVSQIADSLGGCQIADEGQCARSIEYFMVGGLGMDSGELYFGLREKKAVIVRGDRPDIQMAALKTPTACMILTNGVDPIEYVSYEAELEDVPIIVTKSNTLDAMTKLHELTNNAQFDHVSKVGCFIELIRDNVAIEHVYSSLEMSP